MTAAPIVLGFDTSAAHCAAALLQGDRVLSERHLAMQKGQGEALFALLDDVLAEGGKNWGDLAAVGVGTGPGNFTGIRISVAAARGLSMSLGVPAVGVSMLEALALGSRGDTVACLDAHKESVYLQQFNDGSATSDPAILSLSDMDAFNVAPMATAVGPAAADCAVRLGLIDAPAVYSPAIAIAKIAAGKFTLQTSAPVPLYIRAPDAAPSRVSAPADLDR